MRRLGMLVSVLVLLASAARPATAADTSLIASQPGAGTGVSYLGPEGDELALLTVEAIVEPFRDYDLASAPGRGTRFVQVQLTVENRGTRALAIDPSSFSIQDTDGFLAFPEAVTVSFESEAANPPLVDGEIAPDQTVTGSLIFQVVSSARPARVVFQPSPDRLLILADLTSARTDPAPTEPEENAAPVSTEAPPLPSPAPADTQTGSNAILLVTHSCPPGMPLPDLQVTPCPRVAFGFEPVLTGSGGTWTLADIVTEQAGPVWHAVPDGQYVLTFTALPDGHDLFYAYGEGTPPTVDFVGGEGVGVTVGPDTVTTAGILLINIYFVDSEA